jgi:hypothetical protein
MVKKRTYATNQNFNFLICTIKIWSISRFREIYGEKLAFFLKAIAKIQFLWN